MRYTENLHLNLPGNNDPLDIEKLDENFEVLDAAVVAAGGDSYQVGDIIYTLRSDLGDDWLLCNGAAFDPDKYPDLANIPLDIAKLARHSSKKSWVSLPGSGSDYPIAIPQRIATDGNTIAFIAQRYTGNVWYRSLYYTDDGFKTIKSKGAMGLTGTSSYTAWSSVFYVNGRWLLVFNGGGTANGWYTTLDLKNEDGSTLTKVPTPPTSLGLSFGWGRGDGAGNGIGCIVAQGRYYNATVSTKGPTIVYANTPYFENAATYLVPMSNYVDASDWYFVRTNKYYVWVGYKNNYVTDIVYSENLLSGYKEVRIYGQYPIGQSDPIYLTSVEDRVFWGYKTTDGSYGLAYIDDIPNGIINTVVFGSFPKNIGPQTYVMCTHGIYNIFLSSACIVLTDLNDVNTAAFYTFYDLFDLSGTSSTNMASGQIPLIRKNELIMLIGGISYAYPGAGAATVPGNVVHIPLKVSSVPDIDFPQGNAYIKASAEGSSLPGGGSSGIAPGLLQQLLAQKGDTLSYDGLNLSLKSGSETLSTVQVVGGEGEGGTFDHRLLGQRDAADQHPISAITGLSDTLSNLPRPSGAISYEELLSVLAPVTMNLVNFYTDGTELRTSVEIEPLRAFGNSSEILNIFYNLSASGTMTDEQTAIGLEPPPGYAFTQLVSTWQPVLKIGYNPASYIEGELQSDGSLKFYIDSSMANLDYEFVSSSYSGYTTPAIFTLELE